MRIKNLKPGDVINIEKPKRGCSAKGKEAEFYFDNKWIVVKIYRNIVLTRSKKIPQIRRCFSFGDLVMLGIEESKAKQFGMEFNEKI